jgi:hypothetical protein
VLFHSTLSQTQLNFWPTFQAMTLNVSDFPSGKELVKLVNDEIKPKTLALKVLQLAAGLANEAANNG